MDELHDVSGEAGDVQELDAHGVDADALLVGNDHDGPTGKRELVGQRSCWAVDDDVQLLAAKLLHITARHLASRRIGVDSQIDRVSDLANGLGCQLHAHGTLQTGNDRLTRKRVRSSPRCEWLCAS